MNTFTCPMDCLAGVGEVWSGEYEVPALIKGAPVVLDIGANVGAFALWARMKWRGCRLYCYEPNPTTFEFLSANLPSAPDVTLSMAAVGNGKLNRLFLGDNTRLCCSQYQLGRQTADSIEVPVVAPENLPRAHIVKIDAEGAEAEIVERLQFVPDLLLVEWHSDALRARIEAAAAGKMTLLEARVTGRTSTAWGLLKYAKVGPATFAPSA